MDVNYSGLLLAGSVAIGDRKRAVNTDLLMRLCEDWAMRHRGINVRKGSDIGRDVPPV